jgi:hypothetical protein
LVELSNGKFTADLSSSLGGDLVDEVNGTVEGVGFEDGTVLLGVDAVYCGLDVIDGSCLKELSCLFNVVDDVYGFAALRAVHDISEDIALEPLGVVKLDVRAEG